MRSLVATSPETARYFGTPRNAFSNLRLTRGIASAWGGLHPGSRGPRLAAFIVERAVTVRPTHLLRSLDPRTAALPRQVPRSYFEACQPLSHFVLVSGSNANIRLTFTLRVPAASPCDLDVTLAVDGQTSYRLRATSRWANC